MAWHPDSGCLTAVTVGVRILSLFLVTTHQMYKLRREMRSTLSGERLHMQIIRPSRISTIFISHMHGDHVYGLPAFLNSAGISRYQSHQVFAPVDIYGPFGLAKYLRTIFQLTDTKTNCPCIVHELFASENDPRLEEYESASSRLRYEDRRIQVQPLFPSADGFWDLCQVWHAVHFPIDITRLCPCRKDRTHHRMLRLLLLHSAFDR